MPDAQALAPTNVRFWRHAVLIAALLLARPTQSTSWEYGAGMWVGCLAISAALALVVAGLAFVFVTNKMRGRFWSVFIAVAWLVSALQVAAWWYAHEQGLEQAATSSRYFNPDN